MDFYTLPERPTIWPDYSLNRKPDAFAMPVDCVVIAAAPAKELFHFKLSLVSRSTSESVRIDMKPQVETGSMFGVASVEYNEYEFSRHYGPDPFIVRLPAGTTVATILRIIFDESQMDHYTFVEPGVGCRHWCASVLEKLVERRLVHYSVPLMFENTEIEEHAKFGSAYPMPRIKGTFY